MNRRITVDALKSDFKYQENGNEVFVVKYRNLFSSTAETIVDDRKFQVVPENIWRYRFKLTRDSQDEGTLKLNWKGYAKICLNNGVSCDLKFKGIRDARFDLVNKDGEVLLTARLTQPWNLKKYEFRLDTAERLENLNESIPLLILTGYALNINVNHYMNM